MKEYEYYMKLCFEEAKKGLGFVAPNPLVGAVLVKDNKILAKGYHKAYGEEHAEVNCLKQVNKQDAKGATLYVNIEPCCHWGHTPPCVQTILDYNIAKVVISNEDTDERMCGNSIKILLQNGINVIKDVLSEEGYALNSMYFFYKKYKRPYIILKAAMTLDSKIATINKESKWISGEQSRLLVQKLRSQISAIVIGKNTFLTDKPRLTCRLYGYENKPIHKLIFASYNHNSFHEYFQTKPGKVFVITRDLTENKQKFFDFCYLNEIQSILVEGGQAVYSWFIKENAVDRIFIFINPSFMGSGLDIVKFSEINNLNQLKKYKIQQIFQSGEDIVLDLSKGDNSCVLWFN